MQNQTSAKTWHEKHLERLSFSQRLADKMAKVMGSWKFIVIQSVLIVVWIFINILAFAYRWDPYPFILLNLLFSTQAAYSAPIIMMAQNRQNERDRYQATEDFITNKQAKEEIEEMQKTLARIEDEKLNKILEKLS